MRVCVRVCAHVYARPLVDWLTVVVCALVLSISFVRARVDAAPLPRACFVGSIRLDARRSNVARQTNGATVARCLPLSYSTTAGRVCGGAECCVWCANENGDGKVRCQVTFLFSVSPLGNRCVVGFVGFFIYKNLYLCCSFVVRRMFRATAVVLRAVRRLCSHADVQL